MSSAGATFEPAGRSARAWVYLVLVCIGALSADLVTKYWAFRTIAGTPVRVERRDVLEAGPGALHTLIPPHPPVVVIPQVLNFQLVLNAGAVFGAGQGRRWLFVLFTGAALAFALVLFARGSHRRAWITHVAIAFVVAGGLGNLYDRLVYACVRDFLHPLPHALLPFGLRWPSGARELWPYVSNVADAFLVVGIATLAACLWRTPSPSSSPPARGGDPEDVRPAPPSPGAGHRSAGAE